MKLVHAAVLIAFLLGIATAALAADVDGTWTATFDTAIGEQHYTYTLKADGEKFTGTAKNDMGETKIEDGVDQGQRHQLYRKPKFSGTAIDH